MLSIRKKPEPSRHISRRANGETTTLGAMLYSRSGPTPGPRPITMLAYSMRYHLSSKCAVLPFFLNKDQALRKTPLYTAVIMKGTPRPTRCFQWGNAQLFMAWQRAFACWNPAVGPGSSQRRLRKVNPRRAALVWMGKAALTLFQRSNCIKSAFCKKIFCQPS